jgi:glycosyltransferase involved in cell wall biosynthesis
MQHLVSVITPTYNHQNYIAECINSVQQQSYTNWEMIIVDDGSTDDTLAIAREYAKNDKRITVYTQENIGILRLSETYNRALAYTRGEYIAILEADDYWETDKLLRQVTLLDENPEIILSWGQARSISSDRKIVYNIYPDATAGESKFFNNDPVGEILKMLLFKDWIPALTIMVRKEALLKICGFQQYAGMPTVDLPTLLQLSLIGKFGFIPAILGSWRNYAGQITKVFPAALSDGYFKLVTDFINAHADELSLSVSEIRSVNDFHHRQHVISYSRSGRYKLVRKQFRDARKDYLKSILKYNTVEPIWKLRSLVGLVFSFLHMDVEKLSSLLGKKTYTVD